MRLLNVRKYFWMWKVRKRLHSQDFGLDMSMKQITMVIHTLIPLRNMRDIRRSMKASNSSLSCLTLMSMVISSSQAIMLSNSNLSSHPLYHLLLSSRIRMIELNLKQRLNIELKSSLREPTMKTLHHSGKSLRSEMTRFFLKEARWSSRRRIQLQHAVAAIREILTWRLNLRKSSSTGMKLLIVKSRETYLRSRLIAMQWDSKLSRTQHWELMGEHGLVKWLLVTTTMME